MKWTLTQSQNFSRAWTISLRLFTRAACASVFFLALLLPFSSSLADDRLSVADLSEEEFNELAALSVGLRAAAASPSGNITNDVASILQLLNAWSKTVSGSQYLQVSLDRINSNLAALWLNRIFSDSSNTSQPPAQDQSYLYQIRELLKTFPTNYPAPGVDVVVTNSVNLGRIESTLSYIEEILYYLKWSSFPSVEEHIDDLGADLGSFQRDFHSYTNWLSSFEYSAGLWNSHIDDSQFSSLLNAVSSLSQSSSTNIFAIGDFQSGVDDDLDAVLGILNDIYFGQLDIYNSVWNIEDSTRAIHYDDFNYNGTDRSVQSDFRFLQQQIGVENPSPTNNLYSALVGTPLQQLSWSTQLNAVTNSFNAESARSERSASNALSQAESDIASVTSTNNLDYDRHWYNQTSPVDELDGLGSSALIQFRNAMPSMPDATDWTITLFNGNFPVYSVDSSSSRSSGSLSSQNVPLNISYALRDNDAVSGGLATMNGIMEVVWDLCELVLVLWMYKRFYDDVVSGNFERM